MKGAIYNNISFDGMYEDDKVMYLSSSMFNGMLKVEKQSKKIIYVQKFPKEQIFQRVLHHKIYKFAEYLIFAPDHATNIHIYDMENETIQSISLSFNSNKQIRCIDSYLDEGYLWLFYSHVDTPIVVVNLKNFRVEYVDVLKKIVPSSIAERQIQTFWSQWAKQEHILYGGIWGTSYIVKLNIATKESTLLKVPCMVNKISTVAIESDNLWIAQLHDDNIYRWNVKDDTVTEYGLKEKTGSINLVYNNIICINEEVLVVPEKGHYIFVLDESDNSIKKFCAIPLSFEEMKDERISWRRFYSYDIIGDKVRLYPANANGMVVVDCLEKKACVEQFEIDLKKDQRYKENILFPYIGQLLDKGLISKSNDVELDEYLDYLVKSGI